MRPVQREPVVAATEVEAISRLALEASIEINVQDIRHLDASRAFLPEGKRVYVSHLPKQAWGDTIAACRAVGEAGFAPIPHIPVRLLEARSTLDRLLASLARETSTREVLLVAGDYPQAAGPFSAVADVMKCGVLTAHGFERISLAGHPEGHPSVPVGEIRRAEIEKSALADAAGLQATFVTQFIFESRPFLSWAGAARAAGVNARIVAGLCGPAGIATLFKYALRCGVGPSIRALGAKPSSFAKLIGEHGPEKVVRELAAARSHVAAAFDGIHLFCFGGYLRTCEWLWHVAAGRFALDAHGAFALDPKRDE